MIIMFLQGIITVIIKTLWIKQNTARFNLFLTSDEK